MKIFNNKLFLSIALVGIASISNLSAIAATDLKSSETITLDINSKSRPFPHFWEKMFGSGRAILSLRESYRKDLKNVKNVTSMTHVRPHAIFHDEIGIYDEDAQGNPVYNFSYVDQIYDGMLENGVRPFIELSFMPRKLALRQTEHAFWYKQITAPPKDMKKWEDLVFNFTKHIVERYGIDEVSQWYFEVWNEPNIDFWSGEPKESTYYDLYDASAMAVKKVSNRLKIGGPATAQAAWVDKFIKHCVDKKIPVDFVTTHVYANDSAKDVFGTDEQIPRKTMVFRSVKKVYDQVKSSNMPNLPIIWSEYNASYKNEVNVTDSPYMGPWMANNIMLCDGMTDMMSYWDASDVFEEFGVVKKPFYGGFGLIAAGNIPKASYNVFKVLHKLGDTRIMADSDSALLTKNRDGSLVAAIWNYAEPEEIGINKKIKLVLKGLKGNHTVKIYTVDKDHGSALTTWEKMGQPDFPSREQQKELRKAGELPEPEIIKVTGESNIDLNLMPHSLKLLEITK